MEVNEKVNPKAGGSETIKAIAYLRISQEGETAENQKHAILEWAKKHNIKILAWFKDEEVSGAIPPREREGYKAMIKFCKDNNIKTVVFYDLSRLARNLEEGLLELKRLADEGFNFYFAGQDFLNYIDNPLMKKKIISDFLWFAELYREDVIKRTKAALKRLKAENRVISRPSITDSYALYLFKKEKYSELTPEERQKAKEILLKKIGEWQKEGASIRSIMHLLKQEFKKVNSYLKERKLKPVKVGYATVYRLIKTKSE